jgi:hypothetical protein
MAGEPERDATGERHVCPARVARFRQQAHRAEHPHRPLAAGHRGFGIETFRREVVARLDRPVDR